MYKNSSTPFCKSQAWFFLVNFSFTILGFIPFEMRCSHIFSVPWPSYKVADVMQCSACFTSVMVAHTFQLNLKIAFFAFLLVYKPLLEAPSLFSKWGPARIRHSIREIATQPVILWILLVGKSKWLPLNFRFNDVIRMASIVLWSRRTELFFFETFSSH